MSTRGEHLVRADRGFATGGGTLAWWISPAFDRLIAELNKRIERGGLEASLPDGKRHRLGFRAPGPSAAVHIGSWMALVRLATSGSVGWYKAWTLGEWSSPDPVAIFEIVFNQCRPARRDWPREGPVPLDECAPPTASATMHL